MDGRSRVILPQANTYLEASGPSALTLLGSRRRNETEKGNLPRKEEHWAEFKQSVWAFLMITVSLSSNKSNTNVVCRSPQVIFLHFCRRQTKEAISYIYLDVQMWKMAWEQMSFSRNPDFRCPVSSF